MLMPSAVEATAARRGPATLPPAAPAPRPAGRYAHPVLLSMPAVPAEHRTGEGWLYGAVVLDASSRRVLGWSLGASAGTDLVVDALGDGAVAPPAQGWPR